MLVQSADHPGLLMRVLASGQRRGNPDGGSHADHRWGQRRLMDKGREAVRQKLTLGIEVCWCR